MRSLLLLPVALLCSTGPVRADDDWHFATKADARAGRRTPGRAVPDPPPLDRRGLRELRYATVIGLRFPSRTARHDGDASASACSPTAARTTRSSTAGLVYSFSVGAATASRLHRAATNATTIPRYVLGTASTPPPVVWRPTRASLGAPAAGRLRGLHGDGTCPRRPTPSDPCVLSSTPSRRGRLLQRQGGVQCVAGPHAQRAVSLPSTASLLV